MKLTKHASKNKIRSRVVSFLAVLALILCTVLSFGLLVPTRPAKAEGETTESPIKTENGIRFVQVAAGYDFAIGLTYDRKLYGWSLGTDDATANSLGNVYTATPTEIPVTFYRGPSDRRTDTFGTPQYDTPRTDDRISSIAATGTTAAFITEKGYLYTWGVDKHDVSHGTSNDSKNYLLLRKTDNTYSWRTPYIIDYHYYGSTANGANDITTVSTEQLIPSADDNILSLAAGENCYILMYERNYGNGGWAEKPTGWFYHTFVWGSALYNAVNTSISTNYNSDVNLDPEDPLKVFNTFISSRSSSNSSEHITGVTAVAGGYTVGINNGSGSASIAQGGTSLQLRGRNFLSSRGLTASDSNNLTVGDTIYQGYTVEKTANLLNAAGSSAGLLSAYGSSSYRIADAIAGGRGGNDESGSYRGIDTEQYYARQANIDSSSTMKYNVANADNIISSAAGTNNAITTYKDGSDNEQTALTPVRYPVSLGNDIGYGISDGKLYGWGDNTNNQLIGLGDDSQPQVTQLLTNISNAVSVAAGKQKSSGSKPFAAGVKTINNDNSGFENSVKNDDKYISAVLTRDGSIYAWTKGVDENTAKQPITYMGSSGTQQEKFAAIYSGYGENLFAVTESGKLVRITVKRSDDENKTFQSFEQYVYDEFYYQGGTTKVKNWDVNITNSVVFNVPTIAADATTEQKVAPKLGNATFYVWSATAKTTDNNNAVIDAQNISINNGASAAYKTLVSVNNIGDAYRIIGFDGNDANISYIYADNLSASKDDSNANYYAPRFYFDGNEMTDVQRENMFIYKPVYDATGAAVGIYIEPKQSTKGKNIEIRFYVARYNSYGKYSVTSSTSNGETTYTSNDNAIYYDYKPCTITFSVKDTASVLTYSAYNADNKSNIPLLDPNNAYNTHYSLAVQNVSKGVDELIKFLTGHLADGEIDATFKSDILDLMRAADKGFPDSKKVGKGDLNYYLSTADLAHYTDVYQYLMTDRDGDRIKLTRYGVDNKDPIMSGQGVTGNIESITIKVELKSDYNLASGFNGLSAADFAKKISLEFDNKYGLYDFAYSTATENEQTKNYLTFKYEVLTFTATESTGTLSYGSTGTTSANMRITDYNTISTQDNAAATLYADTINSYNYKSEAGYVEGTGNNSYVRSNLRNVVRVFAQPSLRLRSDLVANQVIDVNGQATGNKNTYTINDNSDFYVGDSKEIKLSDFFDHFNAGTMSFSFNNSATTENLEIFSKQFPDNTGHNMPVVTLSGNTIVVHPTTSAPINFTVEIQRFADDSKSRYFTNGNNGVDEKIYIRFNFNKIIGFNMAVNNEAVPEDGYLITDTSVMDLFAEDGGTYKNTKSFVTITRDGGGAVGSKALAELKKSARIYAINWSEKNKGSDDKLFDVIEPVNGETRFTITPKRSGTGIIQFSANIYDKTVSFILKVNISSKTTLNSTLTIIDDGYVTISDLDKALQDANGFNDDVKAGKYKILYDDYEPASKNNDRIYNAIYFTDEENNRIGNKDLPFISNAVFETETENSIRVISSNSTTEQSKTYYMHVQYTNANVQKYSAAPAGSIIEVIVPVVSGKIKLQSAEGGDLVANIDCRHTQNDGNWWKTEGKGLDTTVTIDLLYLLNLDQTQTPDKYKIFLLSADSEATQYFQYDKGAGDRTIIITPKDNTENKRYELNVSVYMEGSTTTKVLSFGIAVKGILTKLPVMTDDDGIIGYGNIWLYSFAIVFGVLFIIFMIRFIVYIRRRSKQRAIIKRNQDLIRMRDRMHGKATAASREQLVKSKLKMEDPKYAKMFNDMRKNKEEESGVTLENSDLAATAERKTNKKKKKGGKKSVAELKAELEAKKAAFAAAQTQNAQPVNPFVDEVPMDGGFAAPDGGYAPDGGFGSPDGGYAPDGGFGAQNIDGNEIIFDASDIGDGNM